MTFASYTLSIAPVGGEFRTIAVGAEPITGVLGRIDPTILANGEYTVRLTAVDVGGNDTVVEKEVEIGGRLKLGNFSMTFTDLEVPVSGIPITLTRTYDTLRATEQGDFGYGWQLDITSMEVEVKHDAGASATRYGQAFRDGTRVTVTLPDGTEEGFTFYGQQQTATYFATPDYLPRFQPDYGVRSRLIVDDVYLRKAGSEYIAFGGDIGETYTPANPGFGGAYTLILANGTELTFNARSGEISSIADRNGNTLTFTHAGITSSSGRGVGFERDYDDRITAVIDPAGNRIRYQYDAAGDLVAVTDRTGNTATLGYHESAPHYLTAITDARGVRVLDVQYGPDGRVESVADASGSSLGLNYNLELAPGKFLEVMDTATSRTDLVRDARGNLIRQVQWLEDPSAPGSYTYLVTAYEFDAADNRTAESVPFEVADESARFDAAPPVWATRSTFDAAGNELTTTDALGNVTRRTFDGFGNVLTVTDPLGNRTTNAYESRGNLTRTTDASGNFTTFSYSTNGLLNNVRDAAGNVLSRFAYDQSGAVTSTTNAEGFSNYFEYNDVGLATRSYYFFASGAEQVKVASETSYDADGRVIGTSRIIVDAANPAGRTLYSTSTSYNAGGQVESSVDRFGLVTENLYDVRGQLIQTRSQSIDENGAIQWIVTRTLYDSVGRADYTTDQYVEGDTAVSGTHTIYDSVDRVVKSERLRDMFIGVVGAAPELETVLVSPGTVVSASHTIYAASGRVERTIDDFGTETRYLYDAAGRQIETRTQAKDENGTLQWLVSRSVYDAAGRPVVTTDRYVEGAPAPILATRSVYDELGRTIRTERVSGVVVDITGAEPNLQSVVTAAGTVVWATETVYNALGQVSQSIGRLGEVTDFEYDTAGRQTAVLEPAVLDAHTGLLVRHRVESQYDAAGNLVATRDNIIQYPDGTIDATNARTTLSEVDAFGRTTVTTYSDGTTTSVEFDDFGRQIGETDQAGLTRSFEYDNHGRLVAVVLPAVADPENGGQPVQPRYEYAYDSLGNNVLIRDALGRKTVFAYDDQGRQTSRTLPEGESEDKRYDDRGRIELEVSFEGRVTEYVYDDSPGSSGRLVAKRYYPTLESFADGEGSPAEITTYTFDAFRREVGVVQDRDGDLATTADQRITSNVFDAEGRLVKVATPEGIVHYEFDPVTGWQVRTYTGSVDTTGVPAAGDGIGVTDTRYSYDTLGRLDAVLVYERNDTPLATPEVTDYVYDLVGNLDEIHLPNGVVSDYVYDSLGHLELLTHYGPEDGSGDPASFLDNAVLARYDYDLLPDGRRSGVVETDADGNLTAIDWFYDGLGRLTREVYDSYDDMLDFTADYVFDLVGNRLAKLTDQENDGSVDERIVYHYDDNDRLLLEQSDEGDDGTIDKTTAYEYGPSNDWTEQTRKTVWQGTDTNPATGTILSDATYAYNLQGRMSQVVVDSNGNGTTDSASQYEYADDGARVSETVNGTKTLLVVDRQNPTKYSQVLEEKNASGTVLKTFTLGRDVIAQQAPAIQGGGTLYLLKDGHGSTRGLVDALGLPLSGQIYRYDAFGNPIGFNPANALTSRLYNSEPFLGSIGLYDFRFRPFDPPTGRFLFMDDPTAGKLNDPLTLHTYLFAHGDGINFRDPTGKFDGGLVGFLGATAIRAGLTGLSVGVITGAASKAFGASFVSGFVGGGTLTFIALAEPARFLEVFGAGAMGGLVNAATEYLGQIANRPNMVPFFPAPDWGKLGAAFIDGFAWGAASEAFGPALVNWLAPKSIVGHLISDAIPPIIVSFGKDIGKYLEGGYPTFQAFAIAAVVNAFKAGFLGVLAKNCLVVENLQGLDQILPEVLFKVLLGSPIANMINLGRDAIIEALGV